MWRPELNGWEAFGRSLEDGLWLCLNFRFNVKKNLPSELTTSAFFMQFTCGGVDSIGSQMSFDLLQDVFSTSNTSLKLSLWIKEPTNYSPKPITTVAPIPSQSQFSRSNRPSLFGSILLSIYQSEAANEPIHSSMQHNTTNQSHLFLFQAILTSSAFLYRFCLHICMYSIFTRRFQSIFDLPLLNVIIQNVKNCRQTFAPN